MKTISKISLILLGTISFILLTSWIDVSWIGIETCKSATQKSLFINYSVKAFSETFTFLLGVLFSFIIFSKPSQPYIGELEVGGNNRFK